MSLQFSNRNRYLFAEQSSEDTDAVDALLTSGVTFQQVNSLSITPEGTNDTPERASWSASGQRSTFIKHRAAVEAEIPLTMSVGDNNAAPYYHPLLKAANLSETLSQSAGAGTDTATYRPSTPRVSMATIYKYMRQVEDNMSRLRYITDVVGSLEISLSAGEEAMMTFNGQGYFNEVITSATDFFDDSSGELIARKDGTSFTPGSQSLADKNPVIPREMTIEVVDGQANTLTSLEIGELTFDFGWSQDQLNVTTANEGKIQHYNTRGSGEAAQGGFNLLNATNADFDNLLRAYKEAEQIKITATLEDVRAANTEQLELLVPNAQLMVPERGENNNLASYQFNFNATRDTSGSPEIGSSELEGDNDFQLTYSYIS